MTLTASLSLYRHDLSGNQETVNTLVLVCNKLTTFFGENALPQTSCRFVRNVTRGFVSIDRSY